MTTLSSAAPEGAAGVTGDVGRARARRSARVRGLHVEGLGAADVARIGEYVDPTSGTRLAET